MATNEEPVRSETPPPAYSTVVDLQRPPPSYNSLWVSSPTADYAQNIAQEEEELIPFIEYQRQETTENQLADGSNDGLSLVTRNCGLSCDLLTPDIAGRIGIYTLAGEYIKVRQFLEMANKKIEGDEWLDKYLIRGCVIQLLLLGCAIFLIVFNYELALLDISVIPPVLMWCNVSVYVGAKTYRSDRAIYSGRRSRSFDNIKNEISDGRREVPLLQFKVEWYDTNIRTWQRHRQIKYIDIPLAECVDASPYLDSNLFGDEENVTRLEVGQEIAFINHQSHKLYEGLKKTIVRRTIHRQAIITSIVKYGQLDQTEKVIYVNGPREKPWYINLATYMFFSFLCMTWYIRASHKHSTKNAKFTYLKLIKLDPRTIIL